MPITQHETPQESEQAFLDKFSLREEKWMGVLFSLEPDGSIRIDKTSWEFPAEKFDETLQLLYRMLMQEKKGLDREFGLLPLAPHLSQQNNGHSPNLDYAERKAEDKDENGDR